MVTRETIERLGFIIIDRDDSNSAPVLLCVSDDAYVFLLVFLGRRRHFRTTALLGDVCIDRDGERYYAMMIGQLRFTFSMVRHRREYSMRSKSRRRQPSVIVSVSSG